MKTFSFEFRFDFELLAICDRIILFVIDFILLLSKKKAINMLMNFQSNMYMNKNDEIKTKNHVNQKIKRRIKLIVVFHIRSSVSYLIFN